MSRIPLVARYPGTAALPRVGLVDAPTPLEDLPLAVAPALESPQVKRDDLTSLFYGGNKVRKLEFLLGEALKEGRRAVITFGAYGSNHALATAVFATQLGLEPHVVLSPQAPGPFAARTLRAHAGLGTKLHVVEGWDGRRAAVEVRRSLAERDGIEPAIIPMGGTNAVGVLGFVNAAFKVLDQAPAPDLVYVAAGTLGTAIGLAIGFAAAQVPTTVVAVRVTPAEVASDDSATKLAADTITLLGSLDATFPLLTAADLRFELRHDWFEPGYGVVTAETSQAVAVAAAEHIKLETTYTGKAFAAMLDDARTGRIAPGSRVVFWDTYNSAPMPPSGDDGVLPAVLQAYVAECDAAFGRSD